MQIKTLIFCFSITSKLFKFILKHQPNGHLKSSFAFSESDRFKAWVFDSTPMLAATYLNTSLSKHNTITRIILNLGAS